MTTIKQTLKQLCEIICNHAPDKQGMLYRNTFANACYFSTIGEHKAADKLLDSLFDQLGWSRRKIYFLAIKESMPEFAREYAREINANLEVNRVFI